MQIFIKSLSGKTIQISIDPDAKVSEIKQYVSQRYGIPTEAQRYVYAGRQLTDDMTLAESEVQKEGTVHLIVTEGDKAIYNPFGEDAVEDEGNSKDEVAPEGNPEPMTETKASEDPKEESKQEQEDPKVDEAQHLADGDIVQIFLGDRSLGLQKKELVLSSEPSTFQVHIKNKGKVRLYGFQDMATKNFLFSSPPFQGLFHGKYGGYQVSCLYPYFSMGEEFEVIGEPNECKLRCYRSEMYWNRDANDKIEIVKKKEEASSFSIRKTLNSSIRR